MAADNVLTNYLKEIAGDVQNLVPDVAILQKMAKFNAAEKTGEYYVIPTQLAGEHGFSAGTGSFTLNAAIAHSSGQAQISGKSLLLRSLISYEDAARAASSDQAFARWNDGKVIPMLSSFRKRLEVNCMYGASGLGVVSAISGSGPWVITLSAATFAPGIWVGAENASLDVFSAVTGGVQRNTGALTITAVDTDARQITVSGTQTGIAANDHLFFFGQRGNEMTGLDAQLTNTGTLFNISASTYSLWRPNTYAVGGALSLGAILAGVSKCVNKGLDEAVSCLVSNAAFTSLANVEAGLRKYDAKYTSSEFVNGAEAIRFHSNNGVIEIVPHPMVKAGEAFIVPQKQLSRIGATDVTMKMPGQGDELVLQSATTASYEMRAYTEQQLFLKTPGKACKLTGIS